MENGGAHADHSGSNKNGAINRRKRECDEPNEGDTHAKHQGIGFGISISVKPNDGLEDGANHLKGKGDESYLCKAQVERILEKRINRRHQGLDGVIEQMTEAEGEQDAQRGIITRRSEFNFSIYRLGFGFHEKTKSPATFREQGWRNGLFSLALLAGPPNQREVRVFNHGDMRKGRNHARQRGIGACIRKGHLVAHQHRTWILS